MPFEHQEQLDSDLSQARLLQQVVSKISSSPLVLQGDVNGLGRFIAFEVGHTLGIERVSVWLFNDRKDELHCQALYLLSKDQFESGAVLSQAMFAEEFKALVEAKYVDASDPYKDPRTLGYVDGYLRPNGITSMLDAVVRIGEELIGLVCFEHVDRQHTWVSSEIIFSSQLGDQLALAVSIQRALHINEQLRLRDAQLLEMNELLEQKVLERSASLQQARDALMESERLAALGAIVAGVAHELNTPIGNARIVASTMADNSRAMEQAVAGGVLTKSFLANFLNDQRNGTALLESSLEKAATLINSFKNVSVDQSSGLIRDFKLHTVVQDIIETMSPALRKHAGTVAIENAIDKAIVMQSYPGALGQVLVNFINNALLHAFEDRPTGKVTITALQVSESEVELVFGDDGCGISAESMPNIFNPFFTTKLGKGGSGLGLHLVYNIVTKVLNGRILATSTAGHGSKFRLWLPNVVPESNGFLHPTT